MKKINFFIVGAPKSGTSFIGYHLNIHPDIFMPVDNNMEPIELVYMSKDMNDLSNIKTLDDYLSLFGNKLREDSKIICGEKSSNYLHSENAYKEIHKYNPNAKIIVCLRNPISASVSYHNHNKIMGFEQINDFMDAWNAQDLRKSSNYKIPLWARKEKLRYQYKNIYSYNLHVSKYLKTFGKNKVKIVFFEDILNHKQIVMEELFNFLNVKNILIDKFEFTNFHPKVEIKNSIKNKLFYYKVFFLKKKSVRKFSEIIKKIFKIKSFAFLQSYLKADNNTLEFKSTKKEYNIDEKNKKILLENFKESIEDLSKILNKNLDHWLK